jgi:hypothetical protein
MFAFCFALIALFSENVRGPIKENIKKSKRSSQSMFSFLISSCSFFVHLIIEFFYRLVRLAKKSYLFIVKKLTKKNVFKAIIIVAVLVFALYRNIEPLDFMVIFYALATVLFLVDYRITAGVALMLFVICPIALIFKKDGFAELVAVYVYYFLVITVISQIKENFLDNKKRKNI